MKQTSFFFYLFLISIFTLPLTSCVNSIHEPEDPADKPQLTTVTFGLFTEDIIPLTRAENDVDLKYLYVFDEFNGTTEKVLTRTKENPEDNPLSDLSIQLSTGNHTIYFVATTRAYESFDKQTKSLTWGANLGIVWAQSINMTVSSSQNEKKNVSLPLRVAGIRIVMEDAIPSNMSYMVQNVTAYSKTFNLSTMSGQNPAPYSRRAAMPTSLLGQRNIKLDLYTFVPPVGSVGDMTATAYDAGDVAIASKSFTNVTVTSGHFHQYSGNFFSNNQSIGMEIETSWIYNDERY